VAAFKDENVVGNIQRRPSIVHKKRLTKFGWHSGELNKN